jgi:hypothetical protein
VKPNAVFAAFGTSLQWWLMSSWNTDFSNWLYCPNCRPDNVIRCPSQPGFSQQQ